MKEKSNKALKDKVTPDLDLARLMKKDRNQAVAELYRLYRDQFIQFATRYGTEKADLIDAFQDAIIAFYEFCMQGKYDANRSSPKTMIFSMGKYGLLNMQKKMGRIISVADVPEFPVDREMMELLEVDPLTKRQHLLKDGLAKLEERCRQIIRLFYYHGYTIEAIVEELGYQNGNVVRSHKSRCMKRLREFMKNKTVAE